MTRSIFLASMWTLASAAWGVASAQPVPPAQIRHDEGGPVRLVGQANWTNVAIPVEYEGPEVVLLDQGSVLVKRDRSYFAPPSGQIFGNLTSNFATPPFTYTIDLPKVPTGKAFDVDHNGRLDAGVQIWTVELANNLIDLPQSRHLLPLEQPPTFTIVSSLLTRPPASVEELREPVSGKLLVYAAQPDQGFPSGFGADGKLFTDDDPIVALPQGYTVVTVDPQGFTFERSRQVQIALQERPGEAKPNFSKQDEVTAFNSLMELLKSRYAYTDLRHINWEDLRHNYLPKIQAAAKTHDAIAYFIALSALVSELRDVHVAISPPLNFVGHGKSDNRVLQAIFPEVGRMSVGLDVVELTNGRVLVKSVEPKSPAAQAGLLPLTEIIAVQGVPIAQRIAQLAEQSTAATPDSRRLEAVAQSLQFAPKQAVTLRYQRANQPPQTLKLTADRPVSPRWGGALPFADLSHRTVRSPRNQTYGYLRLTGFLQPQRVLEEFSRFIASMNEQKIPGIVLDLRENGGGSSGLMLLLMSHFWSEANPLRLEQTITQIADPSRGRFVTTSPFEIPAQLPIFAPQPDRYYPGQVAILVSDQCYSACEFFADWMRRYGRATVLGTHATGGAGGMVQAAVMPFGMEFYYTATRELDRQNQPYIEAKGVQPNIAIPITEQFVRAEAQGRDPVLNAAMDYLDRRAVDR